MDAVSWLPDGSKLASGLGDKTVIIWNPTSGEQVSKLEGHTDWVRSVAWNADCSFLRSDGKQD
jgi:WD40 repeat protein